MSQRQKYLVVAVVVLAVCYEAFVKLISPGMQFNLDVDALVEGSRKLRQEQLKFAPRSDLTKLKPSTNSYTEALFPDGRLVVPGKDQLGKENATILMLCRNRELSGVLSAMRSLEDHFNREYRYPWTFLNDEPFTENFIEETSKMASGKTQYGLIPAEDWNRPSWIDEDLFKQRLQEMSDQQVIYGGSRSYRNMCRFNSGYFYRQELVKQYNWYFRVEPDVEYFCDFQYDPFTLMRENNKKYGFVISLFEYEDTIPTLWPTVEEFMTKYPQHLHPNNALEFITSKDMITLEGMIPETNHSYNMCHFWSNFEIANLDFFRSEAYNQFFEHLDQAGGFYYERWGDAPVHSIAVSLLMDKNEVHHFEDIGYFHNPFMTCPSSKQMKSGKRCVCRADTGNVDLASHSCLPRWWKYGAGKKFLRDSYNVEDFQASL
ncbi:unnamed protein product [Kuraishia capsulata CBS 1993]|uniref:Glycosyltransferase family 15 protein n=1 Tax=Kuraishia capsulata CBS 1993 TaxID=1382522 RepID=W6MHI5_9ASCO|nr:uncharacterized protein KUCA_T00001421001 [Kuraishia capsulata CBS 1993]CDK25451.1 unnamed protein product [Kuraishia capsulata CBS 1993]